jgi:hypothetical protein
MADEEADADAALQVVRLAPRQLLRRRRLGFGAGPELPLAGLGQVWEVAAGLQVDDLLVAGADRVRDGRTEAPTR